MAEARLTSSGARALLIACDTFEHPKDFSPLSERAQRGVEELRAVLADKQVGLFADADIEQLVNPETPGQVTDALHRGRERPALLLCYFIGHGYVAEDGALHLAVHRSTRLHIESTGLRLSQLVSALENTEAERVVLVLDCCFSGAHGITDTKNAAFSIVAATRGKEVIHAGLSGDRLTPFTRRVVQVLREGVSPTEGVTVDSLCERLGQLSEDQQEYAPFTWEVNELSWCGGGSTVLSRARLPAPQPPDELQTPPRRRLAEWWYAVRPVPGRVRRFLREGPLLRRVLAVLGALVVVAGSLIAGFWPSPAPSCPPPLELRMVTAPEEVDSVTRLVAAFEDSPADHHRAGGATDCLAATVTVYGAGLDSLASAFQDADHWGAGGSPAPTASAADSGGSDPEKSQLLAGVGPQPDLWLAQSSAEVSYLRGKLPDKESGLFTSSPSRSGIAADEPVLVLTEDARHRLGLRPAAEEQSVNWTTLRAGFRRSAAADLRLLRPNPTVSGVGLVQMLGMYHDGGGVLNNSAPLPKPARIRSLEDRVIARGRSIADGTQALCELRTAAEQGGGGGNRIEGALVSRREADQLREGGPLGDNCPDADETLAGKKTETYTLTGVPHLDYPLVQIDWPAPDAPAYRSARDAAVRSLRSWLTGTDGLTELTGLGFQSVRSPDLDLSTLTLGDWLSGFSAVHPDLRLHVLFDVSGSMRELKRFSTAQEAVATALGRLGTGDRFTLTAFPTRSNGTGTRTLVRERAYDSDRGLPELTTDDLRPQGERFADLLGALQQQTADLSGDGQFQDAVLLVTDGDYLRGKPARVKEISALGRGLRDTPVLVASMRPYGCASGHEAQALAAASGGACFDVSDDLRGRLASAVAALTEGRQR